MYDNGHGVRQDYAEAFRWYHKAAEQGDAEAQYNLGAMYHNGDGVRRNFHLSKEWFGKACDGSSRRSDTCIRYAAQRPSENHFSDGLLSVEMVPEKGIEPPTFALRMRCSTD